MSAAYWKKFAVIQFFKDENMNINIRITILLTGHKIFRLLFFLRQLLCTLGHNILQIT